MTTHEAPTHGPSDTEQSSPPERPNPIGALAYAIGTARRFAGDSRGLDTGELAALARLDPDGELRPHQVAALARALVQAGLDPENWRPDTWRRWALIAHGMALTGHQGKRPLGLQLASADIAESRVTRLLTARGEALRQLLPPLLRLLASKEIAPNWYELGGLILAEDQHDEQRAEVIRMKIAGRYFPAREAADKAKTH